MGTRSDKHVYAQFERGAKKASLNNTKDISGRGRESKKRRKMREIRIRRLLVVAQAGLNVYKRDDDIAALIEGDILESLLLHWTSNHEMERHWIHPPEQSIRRNEQNSPCRRPRKSMKQLRVQVCKWTHTDRHKTRKANERNANRPHT